MSTISMKDFLRDNEMDGIANMCQIRAIGFVDWLETNKDCPYIYSTKGWFDWRDVNIIITTEQVYKEYLKYLENESS
jgi:hypothetical protein